MTQSHYDRLQVALNSFSGIVEDTIKDLRNPLLLDILFTVLIPIAIVVVTSLFAGVEGLVATLGMGTINAAEKISRGQSLLTKYFTDSSKLRKKVKELKLKLQLCEHTDDGCLKNIEDELKKVLTAIA